MHKESAREEEGREFGMKFNDPMNRVCRVDTYACSQASSAQFAERKILDEETCHYV
jgi:hypothetical protein